MDQIIHHPQELMLEHAQFSAVLTAHRSLSPAGFWIFMGAISAVSFTAGMVFFMMGAWPVFGFFGLDVVLIYAAFKLNFRAGRAFEAVNIVDQELVLSKVDPEGRAKHHIFNPRWVKFSIEERPGERVELALVSHGKRIGFGSTLNADEKRDFAQAFRHALARFA